MTDRKNGLSESAGKQGSIPADSAIETSSPTAGKSHMGGREDRSKGKPRAGKRARFSTDPGSQTRGARTFKFWKKNQEERRSRILAWFDEDTSDEEDDVVVGSSASPPKVTNHLETGFLVEPELEIQHRHGLAGDGRELDVPTRDDKPRSEEMPVQMRDMRSPRVDVQEIRGDGRANSEGLGSEECRSEDS